MGADSSEKSISQSKILDTDALTKVNSDTEIIPRQEKNPEPRISTAKTLQPELNSTKTLLDAERTQIVEQLPENQPPRVLDSAEGDKTEKLQKLGKYYLLKEISRSPNGVVYKARHEDLHNRIVALKVMPNVEENISGDRISRFKQEINYISSLQHPNIVPVYDIGTTESWLYFTMAYVEGSSLSELIRNNPLPVNHAVRIMIKVAKGIHYANQHGIIHRDIKPSNILLDKHTGEPLIVDFGLAKDIKSDIKITQSGVTLGTPPYMPPEQARGKQDMLDSRSDVYSIGATLYELITKRAPFEGDTGMQILMKVLNNTPPRPRKFNPSVSPDLEAIIMKCLSKKQHDRYQNSISLASDLKKYLSGDWVTARQNTPINRVLTRIYSYRYMIYSILFALFVISIFVISGYFKEEIDKAAVIYSKNFSDIDIVGSEKRSFRVIGIDSDSESSKADLWLHDEIWMNHSTEPFAQSYKENNFAGLILDQPVESTDFELEFDLEIDPSEDEFPNFSFFLLPNDTIDEINPYSDPVIDKGYLLTLGADDNRHWVFYRNGISQIGDSSFSLRAQNYNVKIQVNSGKFHVEVQDKFRQLFTLEYSDEYPIPLQRGGYFGFISVNTPVFITSIKLSIISPATSELEKPNRLFNLGLYNEAMIDYRQKAQFAKVRRNNELFNLARFKEILCGSKTGIVTPEEVIHQLDELNTNRNLDVPEDFEFVYIKTLYKLKRYDEIEQRFFRILSDNNVDAQTKQRIVFNCYRIASEVFGQIYLYNQALDTLKQKSVFRNIANLKETDEILYDRTKMFEMLLLRRMMYEDVEIPRSDVDFSLTLLNMIVNSGCDDEYIKSKSKKMKFITESIRNQGKAVSLSIINRKSFADMLLEFCLSDNREFYSNEMRGLMNYLKLFSDANVSGLSSNLIEINEFLNQLNLKKGFRLKYWHQKLISFMQIAFMKSKFLQDNQTQPEESEDR